MSKTMISYKFQQKHSTFPIQLNLLRLQIQVDHNVAEYTTCDNDVFCCPSALRATYDKNAYWSKRQKHPKIKTHPT